MTSRICNNKCTWIISSIAIGVAIGLAIIILRNQNKLNSPIVEGSFIKNFHIVLGSGAISYVVLGIFFALNCKTRKDHSSDTGGRAEDEGAKTPSSSPDSVNQGESVSSTGVRATGEGPMRETQDETVAVLPTTTESSEKEKTLSQSSNQEVQTPQVLGHKEENKKGIEKITEQLQQTTERQGILILDGEDGKTAAAIKKTVGDRYEIEVVNMGTRNPDTLDAMEVVCKKMSTIVIAGLPSYIYGTIGDIHFDLYAKVINKCITLNQKFLKIIFVVNRFGCYNFPEEFSQTITIPISIEIIAYKGTVDNSKGSETGWQIISDALKGKKTTKGADGIRSEEFELTEGTDQNVFFPYIHDPLKKFI